MCQRGLITRDNYRRSNIFVRELAARVLVITYYSLLLVGSLVAVHNTAASRRREQAIAIGKERREALMRAKRVCRAPLSGSDEATIEDGDMLIDEKADLETRTAQAVEELKSALSSQYVPLIFFLLLLTQSKETHCL